MRRKEAAQKAAMEEAKLREEWEAAASRVQKLARSHLRRMLRLRDGAARGLQWFGRRIISARRARLEEARLQKSAERAEAARIASAVVIQSIARGFLAHRCALALRNEARDERERERERKRREHQGVDRLVELYKPIHDTSASIVSKQSLSFLREAERDRTREKWITSIDGQNAQIETQRRPNADSDERILREHMKRESERDMRTLNRIAAETAAQRAASAAAMAGARSATIARRAEDFVRSAELTKERLEAAMLQQLRDMHDARRLAEERRLKKFQEKLAERRRVAEASERKLMSEEDEIANAIRESLARGKTFVDMNLPNEAKVGIARLGGTLALMMTRDSNRPSSSSSARDIVEVLRESHTKNAAKDDTNEENVGDQYLLAPGLYGMYQKCRVANASEMDQAVQLTNGGTVLVTFEASKREYRIPTSQLRSYDTTLEGEASSVRATYVRAATLLEAIVRGFLRRQRVVANARREREMREAKKIQAAVRSFLCRRRAKRRVEAAVRIQRAFWLSKERARSVERTIARESSAAVKIQSLCRAYVTRSMYGPILSKRSPHRRKMFVATRLQAAFRARICRHRYRAKKVAATQIEAIVRGRVTRRRVRHLRTKTLYAKKIQSLFRGWHARITRRRVVEDRAALRIQAFVRRKVSRTKSESVTSATIHDPAKGEMKPQETLRVDVDGLCNGNDDVFVGDKSTTNPTDIEDDRLRLRLESAYSVSASNASERAARVAASAVAFVIRHIAKTDKSVEAWSRSNALDLRRRTTKKRLLVTLFAEALEIQCSQLDDSDDETKKGVNADSWGTIHAGELMRIVDRKFASTFFPKRSKALVTMVKSMVETNGEDAIVRCRAFVKSGLRALSGVSDKK